MGAICVRLITKSTPGEVYKLINLKTFHFTIKILFQKPPRNKEAIGMIGRRKII